MDLAKLTQTELAELLQLSTRQIRNLEGDGLPSHSRGGKKSYVWREVLDWMRERWEDAARAAAAQPESSPLADAQLRKALAEAARAEDRQALERGSMAADEDSEAEVRRFCERVRAGLLSVPSRHQASIVGLQTIPEAGVALNRIVAVLLTDLQRDAGGTHDTEDFTAPSDASSGAA